MGQMDRMDTIRESAMAELHYTSKSLGLISSKSSLVEDEGPYFFVPTAEKKKQKKKKRERFSILDRFRSIPQISRPSTPSISDFLASVLPSSPEDSSSRPLEQGDIHTHPRPGSSAQSLMTRSRGAIRRHGSKFSLGSFINEEDFGRRGSEISETCRRPSHFVPRRKQSSLGEPNYRLLSETS